MAFDLLMYSFFENGLAFRHNSFGLFFDTDFLSTIPGYVELLRKVATKLSTPGYLDRFILQFIVNNPNFAMRVKKNEVILL